ncbi:MFS transporter [Streptomyces sp. NPDC059460]|uniref:MFS transporter n=1 Tax=Streptomyces sp. NPDC059460 TaxID=3346840 RepID=UPI00367F0B5D
MPPTTSPTSETVASDSPDGSVISLTRLGVALLTSSVGALVALFTPVILLLTLKINSLTDDGAETAFGLITGAGSLFALVANPIAGRISDRTAARFGRRRTWILAGAICGSLVVVALGFTTAIWQVAVLWFLAQTVFNFQLAATGALFGEQVPAERRGTFSGLIGLMGALGPLIGIAAISGFSDERVKWCVVAGLSAFLGILSVLLVRERPLAKTVAKADLRPMELLKSFWLNPRDHPAFGWVWALRLLVTCGAAYSSYNAFFALNRLDLSDDDAEAFVLVMAAASVVPLAIAGMVAGPLSDRLQRQKPFLIAGGAIIAVGLVLMAIAPTQGLAYAAGAVIGLGTGIFVSVDTAISIRMLPSTDDIGKDVGILNLANTLPQSVVPFIAPLLLFIGGFPALYLSLAVLVVAGIATVFRLPEIGREGDPRWAPITRDRAQVARAAAGAHEPIPSKETP